MPRGVTVTDQANMERRLWQPLEALPQAVFDMSQPGTVTVVAGAVSAMTDTTGRYTVTQGTSTNRPAYAATGLNGLPIATGDSTDRLVSTSNTGLLNNVSGYSLYLVGRATSNSVNVSRRILYVSTPTATSPRVAILTSTAGTGISTQTRRLDADANATVTSSLTSNFSEHRTTAFRAELLTTSNNLTIRENGTQTGIGSRTGSGSSSSATNPNTLTLLGDSGTSAANYAFGVMAIYGEAHPLWLQDKLEGVNARRWGLTGSLAIGHPFRDRPPLRGAS